MLTNEQLLAALEAAEANAFGPKTTEIATDRADALDRYRGKPYGDEQAGRSQVVSRDVSDVVEGVTANVLKPFVGGDQVVTFNPRGPEDEEGALQESDYINFIALERNNGFVNLNSAVKDALLLRNGYIKLGWTKREDITIEKYVGLADEELALLMEDSEIEVVGQMEYPDPSYMAGPQMVGPDGVPQPQQPAPMLYDVTVHRKAATEYCEHMPAPPDEILVSQRATEPSVQNADFVQHQCKKMVSEIRQLGYDIPDDISDSEDTSDDIEEQARDLFTTGGEDDPTADPSRRIVTFKETWMRIDHNGDGVAELRRICRIGKNILANEEADLIPIACFTPVLMPHEHLGVSVYDLVKDIAQIKTVMMRSMLDNRYLQNNAEKVINVDAVENIDDFLTSRPGGLKRVRGDPAGAVMPLVVPDTGSGALMTLEYLDSIRENRTGYTKAAEGMKSGSLATDTLGELQQQVSQSATRLEMVARTIAETGMRDLFRLTHAITLKHGSKAEKIRLRGKWVAVNPREWVRRTDMSISVGLGSTTGPQQLQNLMMIGQAQQQAMPLGIVTPENVYNTLAKMATAAGFKNPEEFYTKPQPGQPPPQNKDPLVQAEEVKGQIALQKAQMEQAAEGPKMQMEAQMEQAKAQIEVQQAIQLAEIEARTKIAIAEREAQIEAETKIAIAQIEAGIQRETAELGAETQVRVAKKAETGEDPKDEEVIARKQQEEEKAARRDQISEAQAQALLALVQQLARPKRIVRGPDGRAAGVE